MLAGVSPGGEGAREEFNFPNLDWETTHFKPETGASGRSSPAERSSTPRKSPGKLHGFRRAQSRKARDALLCFQWSVRRRHKVMTL